MLPYPAVAIHSITVTRPQGTSVVAFTVSNIGNLELTIKLVEVRIRDSAGVDHYGPMLGDTPIGTVLAAGGSTPIELSMDLPAGVYPVDVTLSPPDAEPVTVPLPSVPAERGMVHVVPPGLRYPPGAHRGPQLVRGGR
ncbi:MAG: hypothetical protein HGA45_37140 [Chloroflexales bacterium]|nr:hypothetical protein [Chloroflexales bacterium]